MYDYDNDVCNMWVDVYSRVGKPAQQTANSTLAAFVTSAFWHGFYPGYYFAFVFGTLFVETAKMLRRDLGPIFGKGGKFALLYPLYSLIATLLTLWVFNFMCVSFQLLDSMDAWRAMWALRFIPVFSAIAVVILLNITRPMLRKLHPLIKQAWEHSRCSQSSSSCVTFMWKMGR